MLEWFIEVNRLLRGMRAKATDALNSLEGGDAKTAANVQRYLRDDLNRLKNLWEQHGLDPREFNTLTRHVGFGETHDYRDILSRDLEDVAKLAEKHATENNNQRVAAGFEDLLHPIVQQAGLHFYRDGYYREAVLNSVIAIFDLIRDRTGIQLDGANLVTEAFALDRAKLVLSELETESGKNDQKGFMQIMQGMYLGIRNPKAHSLQHDLDERKTAEYLVFASLVVRRVVEAEFRMP
jgi:uncharacterized protein (TIGR02391 family)